MITAEQESAFWDVSVTCAELLTLLLETGQCPLCRRSPDDYLVAHHEEGCKVEDVNKALDRLLVASFP